MKSVRHTLSKDLRGLLVSKISAALESNRADIVSAYLFGSFLSEHTFSDIDIAILTRKLLDRPLEYELALEGSLERIAGYPVDVRIINQAPPAFAQNVFRNGKLILDLDPDFRSDFQAHVLKRYFDIAPYHKRYLSEVVNAPV